jgi:hypothetical protein
MARIRIAYTSRAQVPLRRALQEAIGRLGFKLTLDDAYAPFETAGYLPCTLDGEDAGFDLRFQDVADVPPALKGAVGDRGAAIVFRWAGDPREELAALANEFGALVCEHDRVLSPGEVVAMARAVQETL